MKLTENDWFYVTKDFKNLETPVDNTEVSRDEFLSILSDIKHVLIKAKYHTNQVESTYVSFNVYTHTDERPGMLKNGSHGIKIVAVWSTRTWT